MRLFALPLLVAALWAIPVQAHQGHSAPQPWNACAGHALTDACGWADGDGRRYMGTCRRIRGTLACVRNRPIRLPVHVERAAIQALVALIPWVSLSAVVTIGERQ